MSSPSTSGVELTIAIDLDSDDGDVHPLACVICFSLDASDIKLTTCGHRFCEKCLKRYIETRQRAMQPLICPVCRQRLPDNDLPPGSRSYRAPLSNIPPPQPVADESIVAMSCCCCCSVLGQLTGAAAQRPRVCVTVTIFLWLLTGIFLAAELTAFYVDQHGVAAGLNPLYMLLQILRGGIDLADSTARFRVLLYVIAYTSACIVWAVAAKLLARSRTILLRRLRPPQPMPVLFSSCCVPCSAWQLLAFLGYTGDNYRPCEPLTLPHAARSRVPGGSIRV